MDNDQSLANEIRTVFSKPFFVGIASGCIGAVFSQPFDVLKNHMQTYANKSLRQITHNIYKQYGWRGFFSGLVPQVIGLGPDKGLVLGTFTITHYFMRKHHYGEHVTNITAGALSGVSQSFVANPTGFAKIQRQIYNVPLWNFVKTTPISHYYYGMPSCIARDIVFGAVFFGMYNHYIDKSSHPLKAFGVSLGCTIPAVFLATPFDTLRTYMITCYPERVPYHDIIIMLNERGYKYLFSGATMRMVRTPIYMAIVMTCFQAMNK